MSANECDVCGNDCTNGVGLTTHYRALDKNGQPAGAWQRQRMCKPCAVRLGELEMGRVMAAVEEAERSGV